VSGAPQAASCCLFEASDFLVRLGYAQYLSRSCELRAHHPINVGSYVLLSTAKTGTKYTPYGSALPRYPQVPIMAN